MVVKLGESFEPSKVQPGDGQRNIDVGRLDCEQRLVWVEERPRDAGYAPVISRAVVVNATSFFVIEAANRRIREFRARR